MKKILISLTIIMMSFAAQGQEYFVNKYSHLITTDEEYMQVESYVEFNAFNTTDIILHIDTAQPIRYVQEMAPEEQTYDGLTYQIVGMRLANTNRLFTFSLFKTGELLIMSLDDDNYVYLTNKAPNKKIFKKVR